MISVRRATSADVPEMSRVLTASVRDLCAVDHGNDPDRVARWVANKTIAGVTAMLANPEGRMFVAEHDGTIAAVGAVNTAGDVTLNYVDPAHRFTGVSKALLAAMEDDLRTGDVVTGTLVSTRTARRFYESAGWVAADEPQDHAGMLCYPMTKTLKP